MPLPTADRKRGRVMADAMTFPNTWEEFEEMYSITDTEQIYTNGSRLIPTFRVRQWLDHMDALMNMDGVYDGTADTPQTDCIDKAKADIAERSSWSKTYEAMREPQTEHTCDTCRWSDEGYGGKCLFCCDKNDKWELRIDCGWR